MVMISVGYLFQFRNVEQTGEFVEVEHRLVFAVIAEESDVLAEVHILQVISYKTAVTALNSLSKL